MEELSVGELITFLYCSDLAKTGLFYEKMLGFPIVIDQGACRIVKIAVGGGGYLGYCERLDGPGQISGIIVTFTVPTEKDVDNWYAHLLEQGVTIPDPPKDNPRYDIYHFFFQDPDGYLLEIQAFHDPDWKKIL